jgi:hypothetical protein
MGRVRRHWWVGCAAALLAAACSGGDEPDLADALAEGADLGEATSALFGDGGEGVPTGDDLQWRAARVGDRIAESVEAIETPLDAAFIAGYERAIGAPPVDQVRHIAAVLGHTRVVLARGADDVERTAYALRLGWTLAGRLGPHVDGLDWVVAGSTPIGPDDRAELIAHLEAHEDEAAAELVVDLRDDDNPGVVIDAIEGELAGLVPVTPEADLLTTLHTVYGATSTADGS